MTRTYHSNDKDYTFIGIRGKGRGEEGLCITSPYEYQFARLFSDGFQFSDGTKILAYWW